MAEGYVLSCTSEPVNGSCPVGSQSWVATTGTDPFAIPAQAELAAAFDGAIEAFFIPTMIVMLSALFMRWIVEQVG